LQRAVKKERERRASESPVEEQVEQRVLVASEEAPETGSPALDSSDQGDVAAAEGPVDDGRHWYVIHSYSGYENKVKKNLEQRIESMEMQNQIFKVIVPTVDEVELRDGQRRTVSRRVFPGYILVQMIMSDDSWYVVRNTPGVTGFVGMGNKPTPLSQDEVDKIMKRIESKTPQVRITYRTGQKVRIVEGPFAEFVGTVDDVFEEKCKVKVLVSFFGRETPVELDYLQVEKV
jgi:transcription termination/antitermination protein NusG